MGARLGLHDDQIGFLARGVFSIPKGVVHFTSEVGKLALVLPWEVYTRLNLHVQGAVFSERFE